MALCPSPANRAVALLVGQMLARSTTRFQCVDVRDLAQAHLWLLEHPADREFESAGYIIGGHFYPSDELRRSLEALLGRRMFGPRVPPKVMRSMGAPADSSRFLTRSGLCFRSGDETFADTIRWMAEAGHIPRKKAGRLVSAGTMRLTERHGAP